MRRERIGCNMFYRRELLDELGRFQLGYGCDETDSASAPPALAGKTLLYVPERGSSTMAKRIAAVSGTSSSGAKSRAARKP